MFRVITELAVFGFDDETRRMKVLALNPGVDRAKVQDNTGFELLFDEGLSMTEPPTGRELETLRELDPDRLFTASRKSALGGILMKSLARTFGVAARNFTAYPEMPSAKELIEYGVRVEELGYNSVWVSGDDLLLGVSQISRSSIR